jgi:hypothetical protein
MINTGKQQGHRTNGVVRTRRKAAAIVRSAFGDAALARRLVDGSLRDDTSARTDANRRRASDLAAIYDDLPRWYRYWLQRRNEDPRRASSELIGLSNESNVQEVKRRIQSIKACLKISLE